LSFDRKDQLRLQVRDTLNYYIKADLDGNETIFKEVFENCNDAELKIVHDEMWALIKIIEDLPL
jgi:hypothetical protein